MKKKILSVLMVVLILVAGYFVQSWLNPSADDVDSTPEEIADVIIDSGEKEEIKDGNEESNTSQDDQDDLPSIDENEESNTSQDDQGDLPSIDENGTYTSKDDVALYIYTYGCLPDNFITKKQAQNLGWSSGSLEEYAPGKCIGGDHFGNYEGLLPEKDGRKYTECDIDTLGAKSRGAKRIVFSNDGLIYYTDDHYESFTLLYGEE